MVSQWKYNDNVVSTIQDIYKHAGSKKVYGFVYKLTLYDIRTDKLKYAYVGKKNLFSHRTKYATQTELKTMPKSSFRRKKVKGVFKYYKTVITESNWLSYISSNNFIKLNSKRFRIEREILLFCDNDSDLTYYEAKEIICNDAVNDPLYLNDSISIRRFGKKIIHG